VSASELAAQLHGLEILAGNIEDADHNTTRFLVMTREPQVPPVGEDIVMTSFVFRVRNVAAALYKALGGFASNGINMTKLESYLVGGYFHAAQFFVEVEGHPQEPGMKDALEELGFFSHEVRILGTYPAHPYRLENAPPKE
jgi:prephenate dehydratase